MKHSAIAIGVVVVAGCSGEFTDLQTEATELRGRAVTADGAPVSGLRAYLVANQSVVDIQRTGPNGEFAFQVAPREYHIVLNDGEGNGHVAAAEAFAIGPTDLGPLQIDSLRRWPQIVLFKGVGYEFRLTNEPFGLANETGAQNIFRVLDEATQGSLFYQINPSDGTMASFYYPRNERTDIVNAWLAIEQELNSQQNAFDNVFVRISDGHDLYRTNTGRLLYVNQDSLWLYEAPDAEAGTMPPFPASTWRITRVDRDGTIHPGPKLPNPPEPRPSCATRSDVDDATTLLFRLPIYDNEQCEFSTIFEVDLNTLESRVIPTPPQAMPSFEQAFDFDGLTYVLFSSDCGPTLSSVENDSLTLQSWFTSPRCTNSEPSVVAPPTIFQVLETRPWPGGYNSLRISNIATQESRWVTSPLNADGRLVRIFDGVESDATSGLAYPRRATVATSSTVYVLTPGRTDDGVQPVVLTVQPDLTVTSELLPFLLCEARWQLAGLDELAASPTGRWFVLWEKLPDGGCIERARRPDGRNLPSIRTTFLDQPGPPIFVDNDRAIIRVGLDPLTGTRQLFRFDLPEARR